MKFSTSGTQGHLPPIQRLAGAKALESSCCSASYQPQILIALATDNAPEFFVSTETNIVVSLPCIEDPARKGDSRLHSCFVLAEEIWLSADQDLSEYDKQAPYQVI